MVIHIINKITHDKKHVRYTRQIRTSATYFDGRKKAGGRKKHECGTYERGLKS